MWETDKPGELRRDMAPWEWRPLFWELEVVWTPVLLTDGRLSRC